jgi:hypothetical protein
VTRTELETLAERILAVIDSRPYAYDDICEADRERVASDLAGLRQHSPALCARLCSAPVDCPDARRYADGLLRTAVLYGVAHRGEGGEVA